MAQEHWDAQAGASFTGRILTVDPAEGSITYCRIHMDIGIDIYEVDPLWGLGGLES